MIRAIVVGEPCAQGRGRIVWPKGSPHPAIMDPAKSRNWKATAQEHFLAAMRAAGEAGPLLGPVEVTIRAVFTCPRTDYRKRDPIGQRWHTKRGDIDNVAKATLDAATGVCWIDDAQVAVLLVTKVIAAQGEAPRVEVGITDLSDCPVLAVRSSHTHVPDLPAPLLPGLGVGA